ncbi:MAG: chaperone modulator CbpM [Gammaproteobacteria bacterium]|nr:chaperone modulator CbpM [Gammaproteobacteria bacterium]
MKKLHVGELLDEQVEFTLSELCLVSNSEEDLIIKLVDEGVIEPNGENYENWKFSATHLKSVQAAIRLGNDLGINIEGVALALDLIEEIDRLRFHLKLYVESHE